MRTCDLHTHSLFSDGTDSPEEIVCRAAQAGLSAVALTDHNGTGGLSRFMSAAASAGMEAVAGAEYTALWRGTEVHLLALFIPQSAYTAAGDIAAQYLRGKAESNRHCIEALRAGGYAIPGFEEMLQAHGTALNRAHIARELIQAGYVGSMDEAFVWLREGGEYYTPARRTELHAVARRVRDIGALSVLAHPLLSLDMGELCSLLEEVPLDGLEARYSLADAQQSMALETLAAERGLLKSGGSDYHGGIKKNIAIGTGTGGLRVPYEFFETLRRAKSSIRHI